MLEARAGRLKNDVADIKTDLRHVRDRIGKIEERFARMEGGFDAMRAEIRAIPTVWPFAVGLIGTVVATTALVVTLGALLLQQG